MPESSSADGRLYTVHFAVAFVCQCLFVLANTLLAHFARFVDFLGGTEADIGWIGGVGAVVGLGLRPWMGRLIERLGSRTAWAIGYAVFMVVAPLNLLCTGVGPAIYLLRTVSVAAVALVFSCGLTYASQISPPERRSESIGVLGCAGFIGMLCGPLLGDWFVGGAVRTTADFAWLFGTSGAAAACSLVLLAFLKPAETTARDQRPKGDFVGTVRRFWPGPVLLVNVAFGVCMCVPFVFLSDYVDAIGLDRYAVGMRFFWPYAGLALVLRLTLRQVPDRFGRRKVLGFGMACWVVGLLVFLTVDAAHPGRLTAAALVCGVGHSFVFHTMMALAIASFPAERHGTGSVLALMSMDVGQIAGAPVLGWLASLPHVGYRGLFAVVAAVCVVNTTAYLVAEGRTQRTPRQARKAARRTLSPSGQPATAQGR